MDYLLKQVRACRICEKDLVAGPRPVIAAGPSSKIVVVGQAPGLAVHRTGIPWNDKSGDNLRNWLGVDKAAFYDERFFALMPMGFCYPGKGASGDLPPRRECAPQWHEPLLGFMKARKLILLVGQYAQEYYLRDKRKTTLTQTVACYRDYLPAFLPLPHPSPRNNIWQAKNPWFAAEVLPFLRNHVANVLNEAAGPVSPPEAPVLPSSGGL